MIEKVKEDITRHMNKEVKVISRENRNRNDIFFGKIIETYPHVFIVSNGNIKRSYSYADILSRDITVTFL